MCAVVFQSLLILYLMAEFCTYAICWLGGSESLDFKGKLGDFDLQATNIVF